MKKSPLILSAALIGTLGLSACEVELADTHSGDNPIKKPTQYAPYKGTYTGHTTALSQGLETECDITLNIEQTAKELNFKFLEYDCDNGTTWGFDQPTKFELRKPKNTAFASWDVYKNGSYIGFQNYSNNAVQLTIEDLSSQTIIQITQSAKGVRLENFQLNSNGWTLFKPEGANLTKQ